ncbi:MAG: universal stress protein [Desulfobacteraceae bacterium]|nr:universal stress protein [Desulfobacteraceae bacterium]
MKILFCTGGSEKSENAIRVTASLAEKLGADATVLSVGPSHDSISKILGAEFRMSEVTIDTDRAVAKNISKFAEKGVKILKDAGISAVAKISRGEIADEILKETEKSNYDFIVMAAKGKPGDRHLLGSVTRKVLAKAKIPVYVV